LGATAALSGGTTNMRHTGAAALLGLLTGASAQAFNSLHPTANRAFSKCLDEPGCPVGKPGCKPKANGRPMLARLEMDRAQPHDGIMRYFYLGRGKQVRLSCLHVEHDSGEVNTRLVYSAVPMATEVAACNDPMNKNCGGNCVWSMSTAKAVVQPKDCTRETCDCVAIGDTNGDGVNTGEKELVESRLFSFTMDESVGSGHEMWNGQGITNKDPVIYKAHGGMDEALFFVQYWTNKGAARLSTPELNIADVTASISFTARVELPSDYFCFTEAEARMPYYGADPLENPELTGEAEIPRHAGFQYMIDKPRIVSSASGNDSFWLGSNYRYWDLGTGPQIDLSCVNVWTTMTGLPHSSVSMCTNAQYGFDQMGWNNKIALLGNASALGSNVSVDVLDVFDCNAYTMWTEQIENKDYGLTTGVKTASNPSKYVDPFYSRNLCCYQTTARDCAAQKYVVTDERNGQHACFWNPQNEMCYPADTLSIRSLKDMVGATDIYTIQSGHVHLPQSSYVVQEGELKGGFQGNQMRRWFLRVGNHMRLNDNTHFTTNGHASATSVTCPLSVTVSYKSNTHGGTCEPSGRNMCDAQADMCTKKYGWAVRNGLQFWKKDEAPEHALDKNPKIYNGCNCLKEKEICYRNVGCTSTKKYQLILQNCYDQKCGDYCNSAGSARATLFMVIAAVLLVLW